MKILLLGNSASPLVSILRDRGDTAEEWSDAVDLEFLSRYDIEFIVSYGYRHIVRADIIEKYRRRIVNLHISLLPWNRGADPNLWSFLENTPKGVTIHYMDEGLDTGDIIIQEEISFDHEMETLATAYAKLSECVTTIFAEVWPSIRCGDVASRVQKSGEGSSHRLRDKEPYIHLLSDGWNTPVNAIVAKV